MNLSRHPFKNTKLQRQHLHVQSNLGITTTEGTGSKWSYFSGGLICQVWFKIFQYGVVHMALREPCHQRSVAPTCKRGRMATTMTSGACKCDDRSFGVPTKEKLDELKRAFRSIWRMWSLFSGWIDALGRPLVSTIRISQVVTFSRTLSVHLNPRIEGTEIVCPQFSGGRFCQVVARTGWTVAGSSNCKEAQWPIGYGVGLRIKRSSVRIRSWPLRWVLGQGSLLPLSQGEAFTLASISYLAILVKYILAKKKVYIMFWSDSDWLFTWEVFFLPLFFLLRF